MLKVIRYSGVAIISVVALLLAAEVIFRIKVGLQTKDWNLVLFYSKNPPPSEQIEGLPLIFNERKADSRTVQPVGTSVMGNMMKTIGAQAPEHGYLVSGLVDPRVQRGQASNVGCDANTVVLMESVIWSRIFHGFYLKADHVSLKTFLPFRFVDHSLINYLWREKSLQHFEFNDYWAQKIKEKWMPFYRGTLDNVEQTDCGFLMVLFPNNSHHAKDKVGIAMKQAHDFLYGLVLNELKSRGLSYIDAYGLYNDQYNPSDFTDNFHLSDSGAKKLMPHIWKGIDAQLNQKKRVGMRHSAL